MTTLPLMTHAEIAALPTETERGFGALETERGILPLEAMDVQTRIAGLAAHVTLKQTFSNALDEPLEATYIFPLPAYGAVTSFQMAVDGRIIDGLLKERGEARQVYQQAIEAGHRAAITEEERPDVFTLRVGNLRPGEKAEIRLELTAPLPYCDGEATFRFPLVVAPRYIPGAALAGEAVGDGVAPDTSAVPDASRITPPVLLPGFPNPVALSLAVEVDRSALGASDLRSSLHAIADEESGERWQRIAIQPGERLDRDFVLRFRVADETVRTGLLLHPDAEGEGGTYQLTLVPPLSETQAARPRDVVFVLDRSGSMGGWKMVAARRALARMVDTLSERDRFSVIAFDHHIERPAAFKGEALVPATDRNRFRAIEFLAQLGARGGTEMARPLNEAADALTGGYADREPILVLVTDGQVGNEGQILRALKPRLKRTRVFTLGIDRAVNTGFLKRLAAVGGGACELVESEDRLDEVMARIHRRIDAPVLTELLLDATDLEVDESSQVPGRLPDLFAGAPLVVHGRYRRGSEGSAKLRVRGTDVAGEGWSESVPATATELAAIGPLWARGKLRELEDRYDIDGRSTTLAEEIVQVSLEFGVLCRFTAFVAVDRSEIANPAGDPHRVLQPVDLPSGWEQHVQTQSAALSPAEAQAYFGAKTMSMPPGAVGAPPPAPGGAAGYGAPGGGSGKVLARRLLLQDIYSLAPETQAKRARKGGGGLKRAAKKMAQAVSGAFSAGGKAADEAAPSPTVRTTLLDPSLMESLDEGFDDTSAVLDGYRRRAEGLLQKLEHDRDAEPSARLKALGRLSLGLRALLEDADSVGADSRLLTALRRLAEDLRSALKSRDTLDDDALSELFERSRRELAAFATGDDDEAQPARGRGDFWR